MTRSQKQPLLILDSEIEKTCKRNNKAKKLRKRNLQESPSQGLGSDITHSEVEFETEQVVPMAERQENNNGRGPEQPPAMRLRDIQRPVIAANPHCIRLSTRARNYELKNLHFNTLSIFYGLANEDPLAFIREFFAILQTFPLSGLTEEELKMRCFPYCLKDRAKTWLLGLEKESLSTWDEVYDVFISRYYSSQKTNDNKSKICTFTQAIGEPLHEAWERYKALITQCPHHQFSDALLVRYFYDGLTEITQQLVDLSAGGFIGNKTTNEMNNIFKELAEGSMQKAVRGQKAPVNEVNEINTSAFNNLTNQMAEMGKKLQNMQIMMQTPPQPLQQQANDYMMRPPTNHGQQGEQNNSFYEDVCYAGPYGGGPLAPLMQKNNPYSATYNPGWTNHPNFSWSQQGSSSQPPGFHYNQQRAAPQALPPQPPQQKKLTWEETPTEVLRNQQVALDELRQSNKNIEHQMGQIANSIGGRDHGKLPSNTEINPKEAKAISLCSGKILDDPEVKAHVVLTSDEEVEGKLDEEVQVTISTEEKERFDNIPEVNAYVPPIPFPSRLKKKSDEGRYQKFLEMFKKLRVDISFAEAIANMPAYAKFLKDLLCSKEKMQEFAIIPVSRQCSAIVQNPLQVKKADPGSFTLPCFIENILVTRCLCDLGSAINLMPLSFYRKLKHAELVPTNIVLQLADRSLRYPVGMIEDMVVKVGKFYLPADFIILDMEEDINTPIILGRAFLVTAGTNIDMMTGILTLRVGGEKQDFQVAKAQKNHLAYISCYQVDSVDLYTLESDTSTCPCGTSIRVPPVIKNGLPRTIGMSTLRVGKEKQDFQVSKAVRKSEHTSLCDMLPKDVIFLFKDFSKRVESSCDLIPKDHVGIQDDSLFCERPPDEQGLLTVTRSRLEAYLEDASVGKFKCITFNPSM